MVWLLYFVDVRVIPFGLILLALAGCSEPPQKEIDEARSAIAAAQAAGADTYTPEEFVGATATLAKAQASVAERDYRQALSYAIDARQRAIEASQLVPEARARAKSAADAELKKTVDSVAHLDSVLRAAEKDGVGAQELRAPRKALQAAQTAVQEAGTMLEARKYAEGNARLRGVRENVDAAVKAVTSIPPHAKGKRRTH